MSRQAYRRTFITERTPSRRVRVIYMVCALAFALGLWVLILACASAIWRMVAG